MDTASFIAHVKTDNIYKDIAEFVLKRFDTSSYELSRPLPKEEYKKVIGLRKDELGGKIIIKFVGLRAKTYSYLIDDGSEDKQAKQKTKLKFEDDKNCLRVTKLEIKINYLGKK